MVSPVSELSFMMVVLADSDPAAVAQKHVPYRNSTLTRLLQDSLGGNTRTVLVATVFVLLFSLGRLQWWTNEQ